MNVILFGTSRILYSCAEIIDEYYGGQRDIAIFDTDPSPANRRFADMFRVNTGSKEALFDMVQSVEAPAVLLSVNNKYIIPRRLIEKDNLTLINLHHSLLPAHPGRNAEAWTIFEGDEYGGVTWHYIDAGVDSGAIIRQERVRITETMRSSDLLKECRRLILDSLKEMLPLEALVAKPGNKQTIQADRAVHLSTQVPGGGYLDPDWPVDKISRFLRAMDYVIVHPLGYPMLRTEWGEMEITRYAISEEEERCDGRLLTFDKEANSAVFREGRVKIDMKLRMKGGEEQKGSVV